MQTVIQKQGDRLALLIPMAFAENISIDKDTVVELSLDEGRIVVTPVSTSKHTLGELLEGISESNLHTETDTGYMTGREIW